MGVVAVAGSLAVTLASLLLLLLLLLAPGCATTSFVCGPGHDTTTTSAPAWGRLFDLVEHGGEGLSGAFRPVPLAGARAPAGIAARAVAAAVAPAATGAAATAHLVVARFLQM